MSAQSAEKRFSEMIEAALRDVSARNELQASRIHTLENEREMALLQAETAEFAKQAARQERQNAVEMLGEAIAERDRDRARGMDVEKRANDAISAADKAYERLECRINELDGMEAGRFAEPDIPNQDIVMGDDRIPLVDHLHDDQIPFPPNLVTRLESASLPPVSLTRRTTSDLNDRQPSQQPSGVGSSTSSSKPRQVSGVAAVQYDELLLEDQQIWDELDADLQNAQIPTDVMRTYEKGRRTGRLLAVFSFWYDADLKLKADSRGRTKGILNAVTKCRNNAWSIWSKHKS